MTLADLGPHQAARADRVRAQLETVLRQLEIDEESAGASAWMAQGVCAQTDPEAFFPEKGGSVRAVVAICAGCPVRTHCLDSPSTTTSSTASGADCPAWPDAVSNSEPPNQEEGDPSP